MIAQSFHHALRLAVAAVLIACRSGSEPSDQTGSETVARDGASYFPDSTWRTARREQVGIAQAPLTRLTQQLQSGAISGINSLLIVREGYLVLERYFNGSRRDDVHTMQSVSKSVTSIVTGIAADQGKVNLSASIFDVLPAYNDLAASDARKRSVTMRDLLDMRGGIDFYESPYAGSPLERLNTSRGDWVRIALEPPMNAAPGERWQYNSGGVIVVAAAVRRLTGSAFNDFARTQLFGRIGVRSQRWIVSPYDSLPHTGGGLSLQAVDLARIGYLVLRDGRWQSDTIVSSDWLAAMLTPVSFGVATFGGRRADYGRLWWMFNLDGAGSTSDRQSTIYAGIGNLNQWLFVIPRYDMVVVVTGQSNAASPAAFLFNEILPAVRASY